MPKNNSALQQIVDYIDDAAAIIDEENYVYYVNKTFGQLFGFIGDGKSKQRMDALNDMNLNLIAPEKLASPQLIKLPGSERKISIVFYLLKKTHNRKRLFLLLARKIGKDAEKAQGVSLANPYSNDEEKFRTENISAEFRELIGESIEFRRALVIAQRAAKSNIAVLIIGESGTGKEILARAIHKTSPRAGYPLIDVNCAAIPDSLIESELFGYEKGAFTGAKTEGSRGYFDEAHQGTILLDEVGDASLQTQSKLLRVIETGSFKRVGGARNINVDVRVISSTNRDLKSLIEQNKFREDLFFRLNAFTIYLPPLRERREDIPLLVENFLNLNEDDKKKNLKFSTAAMDILKRYYWPGNVRELKGVVNYAMNMAESAIIKPGSLPSFLFSDNYGRRLLNSERQLSEDKKENLIEAVQDLEKKMIKEILNKCANKTTAIKKLGISRRTFYIKIKQYGLDGE